MKHRAHRIVAIALLVCMAVSSYAQNADELPEVRRGATRGYYHTEVDGEQVMMIVLNEVTVYPPLKFRNNKQRQQYDRLMRDVRLTLPYAKLICNTLTETYEYISTLPTTKEREDHLKRMEGALFQQYKPILKRFSRRQAKVLVKLIRRETDQSSYDIIKAFLGGFRAGFWQTFGRLFGVNLKGDYRPARDTEDAMIERIATQIEQGTL